MMPDPPVADAALRAAVHGVRGLLLDLDGVLVLAERPIDGAAEALSLLDGRGLPYLIVTNTSLVSRSTLSRIGARMGLQTPPERFQSALSATAAYCASRFAGRGLYVLATDDALTEFEGQLLVGAADADAGAEVAAVVLGDAVEQLTREALDRAFRLVRDGAELIGMHRNKWWVTPAGITLDAGAYLAGLEYATDTRATVVGKPSRAFFRMAADRLVRRAGLARWWPTCGPCGAGDGRRRRVERHRRGAASGSADGLRANRQARRRGARGGCGGPARIPTRCRRRARSWRSRERWASAPQEATPRKPWMRVGVTRTTSSPGRRCACRTRPRGRRPCTSRRGASRSRGSPRGRR